MATASSSSDITSTNNEGPVFNLINKRHRALRKKLNRISQMEESLAQGKTLNKEQEETFRSKPSVLAAIDELEKLRQPLAEAVDQEIQQALNKTPSKNLDNNEEKKATEEKGDDDSILSDLLHLLYFGSVFDVKTLMRAHDNMLTRTHERNCCLAYDYVTDDDAAGDPLKEWDLDLIATLRGLLVSRPVNSSLSHKNALQECVERAKLWRKNAEEPIEPDSEVTYATLRQKLNKIMASDYFTTALEIKAPVEVAAAAGNYTSFQVPVQGTVHSPVSLPVEGSADEYQHEEQQSPNSHEEIYHDETGHVEELHREGGSEVENASELQAQTEQGTPDTEADQNTMEFEAREQHPPRRQYQNNYRGGRGGGGRRGYSNGGRGGRSGSRGGGYHDGSGQFYDNQPGGYYPRNNYNYRGRGGRGGMGGGYNNYHNASSAGHAQAAV